jgi:hypothetical protein
MKKTNRKNLGVKQLTKIIKQAAAELKGMREHLKKARLEEKAAKAAKAAAKKAAKLAKKSKKKSSTKAKAKKPGRRSKKVAAAK